MQKRLSFFLFATLLIAACSKPTSEPPVGPSSGFALDYMEVEEHLFGAYLYLYGNFGDSSTTSKVKVGNTLLNGNASAHGSILSWSPFYIKVSIGDPDDDTGAGYVSVLNGGKETNQRMLNVWELSLLYKEPDEGTLLKEVRFMYFCVLMHMLTVTLQPLQEKAVLLHVRKPTEPLAARGRPVTAVVA